MRTVLDYYKLPLEVGDRIVPARKNTEMYGEGTITRIADNTNWEVGDRLEMRDAKGKLISWLDPAGFTTPERQAVRQSA